MAHLASAPAGELARRRLWPIQPIIFVLFFDQKFECSLEGLGASAHDLKSDILELFVTHSTSRSRFASKIQIPLHSAVHLH